MNLRSRFKRAKVARRMLALFLFGALVPIGALAFFSYSRLVDRINAMRGQDLDLAAAQVLHEVQDRIHDTTNDLLALLVGVPKPAYDPAVITSALEGVEWRSGIRGAALVMPDGRVVPLLDTLPSTIDIGLLTRAVPAQGIAFQAETGPPPSFWLMGGAGTGQTLLVQLSAAFLFADAFASVDARVGEVCVVDSTWTPLRCSAPPQSAAVTAMSARPAHGPVTWVAGDAAWLGGYARNEFPGGAVGPAWGVLASAPAIGLVDAVGDFGRVFIMLTFVVLIGVFVFSNLQIRRSLRPLKLLQEATAKIADRRFGEPVVVTSGDEFEELATAFNSMAAQVESQFKALTAMNEIGRSMLSTAKISEIVDTVLDRAPNISACNAVVFGLREKPSAAGNGAMVSGGWRVQGRPVGGAQTISATVAPTRAEIEELWNCSTQIMVDLNESPRTYVDLVELVNRGVIFYVVFPIQLKNQVAGAIAIGFTEQPDPRGDNIVRARRLVDQVTVALANAELINELNKLNFGTIAALARTIDASSPWTAGHSTRVTKMALDIAKELRLPQSKIDVLHRGGLLHDIGKIGTPPTILNKPGRLDPDELKIMQDHTVVGAKILAPIPQYAEMVPIVRSHHERLDGKGYPDGLKGDNIPFLARVLAVADVFDALISDRPYRAGWAEERVVAEIQNMSGTHLDPQVVEAFLTVKAPKLSATRKSIPYLAVEVDDFYQWID